MHLTLGQVLGAPVVGRAKPQVLHGSDLLDREVRWIHTSEIFEIASLLHGSEVLIISGLGLVGADDAALEAYVERLADRGVTALFFELGRTFDRVPPALVRAAQRTDLALVALHDVVPFVDITHAVHRLLVEREAEDAIWIEEVDRYLHGALLDGEGVQELLGRIQILSGGTVVLRDDADRLVASAQGPAPASEQVVRTETEIRVRGQRWGRLELRGPDTPYRRVLARRSAVALGLGLLYGQAWASASGDPRSRLLRDIAENRYISADELAARAAVVGFDIAGRQVVGVALSMEPHVALPAARAAVADIVGRRGLVAEVDGEILVAVAVATRSKEVLRRSLAGLVDDLRARPAARGGGRVTALAAGGFVSSLVALPASLSAAREARALIVHLGLDTKVLLSSDVAVHRLLGRLRDDPEMERFVSEQLGALLDHDAAHRTELVRTLEALVANGWSKTRTAGALGVRRQTIYRRIAAIEARIDGSLDDPESRVQVSLALKARLIRKAGLLSVRRA